MYDPFTVAAIRSDLRQKTIVIDFTSDVDPDSVNDKTVSIMERKTKSIVEYSFKIYRKTLTLTLLEWPTPNKEYVIKVDNLVNAIGDKLQQGVRKTIVFESSLCSIMHILAPSYGESVTDVKIVLDEEVPENTDEIKFEAINSYYIEIATDCNFQAVVKDILITDRRIVQFSDMETGQYYVRARVQKEKEYGLWSETVGFLLIENDLPSAPPDSDDPVYIEEIEILSGVENGLLGDSFLFEMNCEIDQDSIDQIIVIRRDY